MTKEHFSVIFKEKINKFDKSIKVDSDKSISQRSFIIASICEGIFSTIHCLRKLNCKIKKINKGQYEIYGKGLGSFHCKKNTILDFGNSGTAARLLGFGVCSTNPNIQVKLTGDKSLSKRSMF